MHLTHFDHACLLVDAGGARVLVDPGGFSAGFESLTELAAVIVTHQHPDHVDADRLEPLLAANPGARLLAEPQTADALRDRFDAVAPFAAGDETTFGELRVRGVGSDHAVIHPDLPRIGNTGLLLDAPGEPTLFHPGDSYGCVPDGVDVLALPINAPWARVEQAVTFLRAVQPSTLVPIHDGLLQPRGRTLYLNLLRNLGPDDVRQLDLAGAGPTAV